MMNQIYDFNIGMLEMNVNSYWTLFGMPWYIIERHSVIVNAMKLDLW